MMSNEPERRKVTGYPARARLPPPGPGPGRWIQCPSVSGRSLAPLPLLSSFTHSPAVKGSQALQPLAFLSVVLCFLMVRVHLYVVQEYRKVEAEDRSSSSLGYILD